MTNQLTTNQTNNRGEIILYQPDNALNLEVRVEEETVWLTQNQMMILFERERSVITKHINNIFSEGELDEESNVHFLHIANSDKPVKIYNLDVIISVGYRVKSYQGTAFRRWATKTLKEYILKGMLLTSVLNVLRNDLLRTTSKFHFLLTPLYRRKKVSFSMGKFLMLILLFPI